MVFAYYWICRSFAGRIGSYWVQWCHEGDANELDRKEQRCRNRLWSEKWTIESEKFAGLHNKTRYHFWCWLYGSGSWIGYSWGNEICWTGCCSWWLFDVCKKPQWTGAYGRKENKRRVYRCLCHQSVWRKRNSDLDFWICISGLWNGCYYGCTMWWWTWS